jgi:hypothetical protein
MPREDFETPSGFADDFDFYIESAEFSTRDNYMNGQVPLLIWHGHSPDAEDVTEVSFPVSQGWEIRERGARVEHDRRKTFVRNSIMGHLIRRVVDDLNVEKQYPDFVEKGDPKRANIWVGFGFHLKREKIRYPNLRRDDATEGMETERLMPTSIIQYPTVAKAAKSANTQTQQTQQTQQDRQQEEQSAPAGSSVLRAKLIILARQSATREAFQLAALDMPNLAEDQDLMNEVLNDGPQGFYARYHTQAS